MSIKKTNLRFNLDKDAECSGVQNIRITEANAQYILYEMLCLNNWF